MLSVKTVPDGTDPAGWLKDQRFVISATAGLETKNDPMAHAAALRSVRILRGWEIRSMERAMFDTWDRQIGTANL
jgi:hypothetical protein